MTATRYRLYCGLNDRNGKHLRQNDVAHWTVHEVAKYFQGYTVFKAMGLWKGSSEHSIIVEIIDMAQGHNGNADAIKHLANDYAERFNQEAVLVTSEPINAEFAL